MGEGRRKVAGTKRAALWGDDALTNTGVVEDNVQSTELVYSFLDHGLDVLLLANVADDGDGSWSIRGHLANKLDSFFGGLGVDVRADDVRALNDGAGVVEDRPRDHTGDEERRIRRGQREESVQSQDGLHLRAEELKVSQQRATLNEERVSLAAWGDSERCRAGWTVSSCSLEVSEEARTHLGSKED